MKTLEAKPFDQNAENWKRENRLFTSTVLEAGSGAKSNRYARTQKSSNSLIRFRCSNSCFLLETGIAGHEKLFLAKWHPKAEKKLPKQRCFDTADRHEKLYGRSRLYASAQGRHETGGVFSLFSSLSFDISLKNSVQRWSSDFQGLFRVKIRKMDQGSNDLSTLPLTRSLPRDVYIRRQNDHPGGQGRIYTSHLNFVSTHLSKPGHRRGCCCMSPRCLLRQSADRCLLFWAFFIEKTVLLCFARFLSKWRETALWLFPDATSWYELYVWWLSLRRRSRRELSWFRLVESEGEWRWIFAGRGN